MKIKLVLKEDVPDLGITGDVVDVALGYARNYLLPKNLALEINKSTQQIIEKSKKERSIREAARKEGLEALARQLEGVEVTVAARVSDAGTLYGSVTAVHIAEALVKKGFAVEINELRLGHNIKALGEHLVRIHLHPEIDVECKVIVVAAESSETPPEDDIDAEAREEAAHDAGYGQFEDWDIKK
ncbi:MAG: 50S ribosomal protein L9 [Planctomycetes bacterium]|nr:50S ribosomal protein L9 [Planctomycetota bacterium]